MWESRVLQRAFERLELHEGKLSRAVLRGGGGGDVTSLPDTWVGNHPGLPGPITSPYKIPESVPGCRRTRVVYGFCSRTEGGILVDAALTLVRSEPDGNLLAHEAQKVFGGCEE